MTRPAHTPQRQPMPKIKPRQPIMPSARATSSQQQTRITVTTTYEYDVFGRIKKEIKPYDTATHPTTLYQYFVDGTAPEGTLISKREVSGAAGTLDVYTWSDGFGRKIQVQSRGRRHNKTNSYQHVLSSQRRNRKRNCSPFGYSKYSLWNAACGDKSNGNDL